MKPSPMTAVRFLEKHKSLFGLEGWSIDVLDRMDEENESVAETQVDPYEKKLTVSLFGQYAQRQDWKNTLIHELCHARVGLVKMRFNEMSEKLFYELEEDCVNDITRGMMGFIE